MWQGPYNRARSALDAEVIALPLPPDSAVVARHDGLSSGRIDECRGVITQLLVGSDLSVEEIFTFYATRLPASGWTLAHEIHPGKHSEIAFERDELYGMIISDMYQYSFGFAREEIVRAEGGFESVVEIGVSRYVYTAEKCAQAVNNPD
jgi:hypothetical protein